MLDRVPLPGPDQVLRASSLAVLAAVAASGVLIAVAGIDLVDHLDWAPGCVIRAWTGIECPGCGMTRALVLLGQLQFAASCSANPAAPGLAIALVVAVVRPGWVTGRSRDAIACAGLVFVGLVWVLRFST